MFEHFARCPVLRFLIPFVAGIATGDYFFFKGISFPVQTPLWLIASLLSSFLVLFGIRKYEWRHLYGMVAYAAFFLFGGVFVNVRLQQVEHRQVDTESVRYALIESKPELRKRSIRCRARLPEGRAMLYFAPDSAAKTLREGDEILFHTRNRQAENPVFKRMLWRKGFGQSMYLPAGWWEKSGHTDRFSLQQYASDCREKLLAYYRKLGFEGDTFAVLAALTSGYTVELPEELRGSFSASGVSHVLAVSGLHAGLIYMLLLGLLTVVPLWMRGRKAAQCLLVIGLLWAFAFFTGLSPSVVRAAIMFSLLAVSSISGWRTNALNSLAAAAMGMLVYNPCLLYEVSFQLSFVSVSAILIIQPWLQAKWTVNNPVMRKIWSLTTVSLAAQIGVLPLILFYFGSFPVYFLPANLLIVPLVTLIMYVAVAMLAVSFLPFAPELPAYLLKFLIGLLNGMTRRIGELPFATIDNIEVSATGVLLYYVILLCIVGYVLKSSQKKVTYHLLRR